MLNNPLNLERLVESPDFEAVILPDCLGFYEEAKEKDNVISQIVEVLTEKGKVIVALGHGVYALLNCRSKDKEWLFIGYNITGPSIDAVLAEELYEKVPVCLGEVIKRRRNYSQRWQLFAKRSRGKKFGSE